MSSVIWKYVKGLKDEKAVEKFMYKNNIDLPESVIKFIAQYNGARPSPNIFRTEKNNEHIFKALLSYNEKDKETVYNCYSDNMRNRGFLPIGSDPAGNFICVDLINENRIVFFEHESGIKSFVAIDINTFLEELH